MRTGGHLEIAVVAAQQAFGAMDRERNAAARALRDVRARTAKDESALPRRFTSSTIFSPRSSRAPIASTRRLLKIARTPDSDSAPRSTTDTAGIGCAVARVGNSSSSIRPESAAA